MTDRSKFWDRIAERYARHPVRDEESYRRKLEMTRALMHKDMRVLEFACGTGSTAIAHAPHVASIRATDISTRMIGIAREKARAAGVGNVTFEIVSFEDLALPEDRFDMVLGLSILHLVADRDAAIAKAYAALKPGGVFVSSTFCLGDRLKIFKLIGPVGAFLGLLPTLKVFKLSELQRSLTDAGFELDRTWQPGQGKSVFIIARKPGAA